MNNEPRPGVWKNEATRQRWQLFHSAIGHAKKSVADATLEADTEPQAARTEAETSRPEPQLFIAR